VSATTERFVVGFFGALLLAGVCISVVAIELWLFLTVGMFWGVVSIVLIAAVFSGFMHASTPVEIVQ
jgi:hypothetical protein